MKAYLHAMPSHRHQGEAMEALATGMRQSGIDCVVSDTIAQAYEADFLVWWGDKVINTLRDKPRLILEAGYINGRSGDYVRDRLRFVSTGWNGLHGRAGYGPLDCPPDRFERLGIALKPWRLRGKYALVCGQHPGDACAPSSKTVQTMCDLAHSVYKRAIFRPHPLLAAPMRSLSEALQDAMVCITWNSTCAIESVLNGVPTVALHNGSMAYPVTSHSIDAPFFLGSRMQWAHNLAYRQWTHDELADGTAWRFLRHGLEAEDVRRKTAPSHAATA